MPLDAKVSRVSERKRECDALVGIHVAEAMPKIPWDIGHIDAVQYLHNKLLSFGKSAICAISEI
jgi:hypothetical protein